ncbi:unnamed protein product [Trichogramma brassicae]|uniref:Uncharacterized protein n=1 Tax=Trichogramma brassicae TaxID=86971 RepID=A0A6H5IM36_9HYME|nr:unnamed protein product [Trichogramma brassicae]
MSAKQRVDLRENVAANRRGLRIDVWEVDSDEEQSQNKKGPVRDAQISDIKIANANVQSNNDNDAVASNEIFEALQSQTWADYDLDNAQISSDARQLRGYSEQQECTDTGATLIRSDDIPSKPPGNCLFYSLIKILDLDMTATELRRLLLQSPFLESCNDPREARAILTSPSEWGNIDCVTPSLADRRRFSASLGSAPLLSRDSSGGPHYRRRCRRRAPAAPRYISRRTGPLRHSLVSSCAEHISRTSGEVRHSRSPRVTKTQRRVLSRITGDCTYLSDFQRSRNSILSSSRSNPKLDSERGAVRRVASVGVLPSGSTLRRPVIQVHRPLRRAVVLSDSPPVRCIKKPPPPSRSSPSTTPTDPPSAQLPTKRPVIQVPRPLRRAVVLSDSPPVRRAEKPKPLPPPVTVPAPEELPCIRQLTRPVLVTPEQRPPACETPGKRQPLPPRPAGRELDTLPESFRGLAIRTPKLRLNDDVPASDPSDGTRDLRDRLNELRLASPPPSRPRSIRRRRDGKYKTRSTLRRDRARLRCYLARKHAAN